MELPFAAITEHFIEELEYMEPFGKGNTKLVFAARGVVMQHVVPSSGNKNVAKATAIDAAGNRMRVSSVFMMHRNLQNGVKEIMGKCPLHFTPNQGIPGR